jgi:hypothetical protein
MLRQLSEITVVEPLTLKPVERVLMNRVDGRVPITKFVYGSQSELCANEELF